MSALDTMFDERDLVADASRHWWIFLLSGIAWLVFALLLFQWDYTTVYAVSILFGVAAIFAGADEFGQMAVSTRGWKIVHAIVAVLFVSAGIWAIFRPHTAFATLAALIGFFFLVKGVFDLTVAFQRSLILLVVYVGIVALSRGITNLFLAFKLKDLNRRIAAA